MKLSDALRFSRERKAWHEAEEGSPVFATDYGIEREQISITTIKVNGPPLLGAQHDWIYESWSEMKPELRKLLMNSQGWHPVDPKPIMLILAEAASDWTNEDPETVEPLDHEEYYA